MRNNQPASKQKGETIARNRREESHDSPAPAGNRQKTKEIRLVNCSANGLQKVLSVKYQSVKKSKTYLRD